MEAWEKRVIPARIRELKPGEHPIETVDRAMARCKHCQRPASYFDGCSVVSCPIRSLPRARPSDSEWSDKSVDG